MKPIHFEPVSHSYTCGGQRADKSVTGFLDLFMPDFDANKVLGGRFSKRTASQRAEGGSYKNKTKEEISQEWELRRDRGSRFHEEIENHLLGRPHPAPASKEMTMVHQFLNQMQTEGGWHIYKCELRMFDEEYSLAGSVDAVFERTHVPGEWGADPTPLPAPEYAVVDWKFSNKQLREWGDERCYHPISHMKSCPHTKYCLQVATYSYLIKKLFNLNVVEGWVVRIPPNGRVLQAVPVPLNPDLIHQMLLHYHHNNTLLKQHQQALYHPHFPQEMNP